jgi:Raf kinase inhibitor-like YbhB/YbcL family protein
LLWNIGPEQRELPEDFSAPAHGTIVEGQNAFGTHGYAGPNPPPGAVHRYEFHLFALDTMLTLTRDVTPGRLKEAMAGHVLGEARLTGKFGRERA